MVNPSRSSSPSSSPIALSPMAAGIADLLHQYGGQVYLVGGSVRDHLRNVPSVDEDLCVTGLPLEQIHDALKSSGHTCDQVGASFGIIKVFDGDTVIDIAIPRTDVNRQQVQVDHLLPIEADLQRRDFTCNAIAYHIGSGTYIGPSGPGAHAERRDMEEGRLRAVGRPQDRFQEDPLRILRGVQLAARCKYGFDETTVHAMREGIPLLNDVAPERFASEFMKGFKNPELFRDMLDVVGIADWLSMSWRIPTSNNDPMAQWVALFAHGGDYQRILTGTAERQAVVAARALLHAATKPTPASILEAGASLRSIPDRGALIIETLKEDPEYGPAIHVLTSAPIMPRRGADYEPYSWELAENSGAYLAKANISGPASRTFLQGLITHGHPLL